MPPLAPVIIAVFSSSFRLAITKVRQNAGTQFLAQGQTMPPSLLILTHEYLPKRAGIATYVSETARAAWEQGWDVTILAPRYTTPEAKERFRVIPTKVAGKQDWLDRLRMREAVRILEIDWSKITLWLPEPGPQRLWMYAKLLGLPKPKELILTLHGSEILRFSTQLWRRKRFAKLLEKAELVSVVSYYTKELLVSRYGPLDGKTKVVYGAVRQDLLQALEATKPRTKRTDQFIVLTLARIHPRKAQDRVIDAIALLPSHLRESTTYRLIGGIGQKAFATELQKKAQALGVRLEGPILANSAEAIAKELRDADLMILTSKEEPNSVESFGLVYLEAAAAGCPVVAIDSGGVSEAISHQSGCILNSATAESLSKKLEALQSNKTQLGEWANAGPTWAKQFSWSATALEIFGDGTTNATNRHYTNVIAELEKSLKSVEAVSLDVFDTALQRVVYPKEIFALVEARAVEAFGPNFKGFADCRIEAEARSRKASPERVAHGEVNLEEIYAELVRQNPRWHDRCSRLIEMEWEEELHVSRPHPLGQEVYRQAKSAGKRVLFVSDMYLGSDRIEALLQHNGYKEPTVLCSADHLCSKDKGTLYPIVAKTLNLSPSKIIHVGDNAKSDYRRAKDAGFQALALRPPDKAPQDAKHFKQIDSASIFSRGLTTRKHYLYNIGTDSSTPPGYQIGYTVLGPFAYGLCRWLVDEMQKRGTDLLLCLGRDGHMPYTILRQWQKEYGLLPDTRIEYFHCSRRACTLALAGDGMSPLVLKTLSQHRRSVPVRDYLERIGLEPEDHIEAVKGAGFSSLDEVVHRKEGRPQMELLFKSLEAPLKVLGHEEKTNLVESLRIKGLDTSKAPALFDLGWRGTQQSALQAILTDYPSLHGYYLSIADSHAKKGTTQGYLVEDGEPNLMRGALEAAIPVLELLYSSPEPSFLYYKKDGDKITPVFDSINPNSDEIEKLHNGASAFITDITNLENGPNLKLSTNSAAAPFLSMALNPTREQADYLSQLVFSDALGKERPTILTKVKPPKLREFIFDYQYFFERYSQTAWRAYFIQQMSVAARIWVTPWSPSFRRIRKAIRVFGG
tara:strand:+ start:56576 stop:59818 length:3243 start_codon:yes stop_codon:yes gene_type:complete